MSRIDATLNERGTRYGAFTDTADIAQGLKDVMFATENWSLLANDQKEALEMVVHKVARILNGDPNYLDSWHDIIGYVRLVEQRLEAEQTPSAPVQSQGNLFSFIEDQKIEDEAFQAMQAAGLKVYIVDWKDT
jgi:hypothetical protein